jgi:hypothetical protein
MLRCANHSLAYITIIYTIVMRLRIAVKQIECYPWKLKKKNEPSDKENLRWQRKKDSLLQIWNLTRCDGAHL